MNLPEYENIRIREIAGGRHEVYDILRQRYVALTPEEWVRQHFVNYLVTEKHYPVSLMGNEIELRVGTKRLRCDSVLYDRNRRPRMIMEYKAESIPLTYKVITQITTYNLLLHVDYLIISNGNDHICLHQSRIPNSLQQRKWEYLPQIPNYEDLQPWDETNSLKTK